jgi:CheY-like chemotaxis protein
VVDGYEVGRRLRSEPQLRQMKLVAITGYGLALDRERSVAAGFDVHMVKPLDISDIERLLASGAGA